MATFKQYTQPAGDAAEDFSITSFSADEIYVRVDGVLKTKDTHYTLDNYTVNGGTITWTSGNVPAENAIVRIYRLTALSSPLATFQAGSSVKAGDLNDNQTQILRALQESGHQSDILVQNWDLEPDSVTTTEIKDDTIINANISSTAEIAVTKLGDGAARQVIQTDAAGTGVEWTSNVDLPGTLDVTGNATLDANLNVAGQATLATVDINGGALDGVTIGASNAGAGTFTSVTVTGNVDGRDVAADGTKLDGIEAGATADQSNAEIRAAVEAATDSNVFTDADHTKLNAIEASATADQTNAEIRAAVEAASDSNVFTDADHTKLDGIATGAEVNVQSDWNASSGDEQILNKPTLVSGINDLSDVDTTGVANDKILKYVSADSKWKIADDGGSGGGVTDGDKGDITVSGSGATWSLDDDVVDSAELVDGSVDLGHLSATGTKSSSTYLRGDNTWATVSGGGGGSAIEVIDESTSLTTDVTKLTFAGAGVTATEPSTDEITITIPGTDTNTTYTTSFVDSSDDCILRLTDSAAGTDDLKFVAGSNITLTPSGDNLTIESTAGGNTSTDFKYLELRNAANNGAASYPAADFTLVTAGTTTALTPAQANALIVSYAGVIQQPNTGTSTPTTGFAISGSTIKFGSNLAAAPDFIIYLQGAGVAAINDNSVTLAKLVDGTSGNNGKFLRANNGADPSWETVSTSTEGEDVTSTTNSNEAVTKFLRADGDGTCSWQIPPDTNTTTFLGLTDTPGSFTADKHLKVNSGGTALEYTDAPSGTITALNNQTADRVTTIGSTTTELDGEADLTFNSTTKTLTSTLGVITGIVETAKTLSANYTINSNNNAMVAGPFSVGSATLTIPSGSVFTVV